MFESLRSISYWMALVGLLAVFEISAQHEIYLGLGKSFYQGDLTPTKSIVSFGTAARAYRAGYRYTIGPGWTLGGEVLRGFLSASDQTSINPQRRARGLDFATDVFEWTVGVERRIWFCPGFTDQHALALWVGVGLGMVSADPYTELDGQIYYLRHYGTEGQLLDNGQTYARWHMVAPFSIRIPIRLSKNWELSLQSSIHLLATDYLDDVADTYPDVNRLREEIGDVAADLSYRGGGSQVDMFPDLAGMQRGDGDGNDRFAIVSISVGYRW